MKANVQDTFYTFKTRLIIKLDLTYKHIQGHVGVLICEEYIEYQIACYPPARLNSLFYIRLMNLFT